MKLQVSKSGLALHHLIMKSNYRQALAFVYFYFYLSKNPSCAGCLMHVVKDRFEHCFLFCRSTDFSVQFL